LFLSWLTTISHYLSCTSNIMILVLGITTWNTKNK
jgi:hypothetical protein